MERIVRVVAMGYLGPALRTATQTALAVLVAAGVDFVDIAVWETALVSGGAAALATLQAKLRV